MTLQIIEGGLEHPDVLALIRLHLASAAEHSPPESVRAFDPARVLYARFDFVECTPFGEYRADPHSVCMTKTN